MNTAVRIVLELMVLASIYGWTADLRVNWLTFTRRARRVSAAILVLLVAIGLAVLSALTASRDIHPGTWLLLGAFAVLNAAMIFRPANDYTTERQYEHLLERLRRR